jgi:dipeptidyl aminopeptidase/acylaminoacyl peptidase
MNIQGRGVAIFVISTCFAAMSASQAKRAIVPSDCVTVRSLLIGNASVPMPIQINAQGTQVAYLVKSPNLTTNSVDIALYVRSSSPTESTSVSQPLLTGELSELQWLGDGRHLTVLFRKDGLRSVEEVDTLTGEHSTLVRAGRDISEYSIDNGGDALVFATDALDQGVKKGPSEQEVAAGYRIPFETPGRAFWPQRHLFMSRKIRGVWTTPKSLLIESPLSHQKLESLAYQETFYLRMSPDGTQVLIRYLDLADPLPESWKNSPFVRWVGSNGFQGVPVLALYDLDSDKTSLPIATPWTSSAPLWSPDSKSFLVVAHSEVGSALEQEDAKSHRTEHAHSGHLFWVEPHSGKIVQAVPDSDLEDPYHPPLFWNKENAFLLRGATNSMTWFMPDKDRWRKGVSITIPVPELRTALATDGLHFIGDFDDTTTPPQIFSFQPGQREVEVLTKLNPQFDKLTLAHSEEIHWKTPTGYDASGLLLLPPDYSKGKRYPLVIQTKPFGDNFACSIGSFPSFAPQPIANAGIMYFGFVATEGSTQREEDYYPKGYPGRRADGGVAEAAFQMDLYDSAVRTLSERGLVDITKVGIIGFSRSGWYTNFTLAYSQIKYRAATTADDVKYSVGEYWLLHENGMNVSHETMYGGPPYGSSLKGWLDYSISFNFDRIHTPILIEDMGYNTPYDSVMNIPIGLATTFEIITGLHQLNKPFELYYYPNEEHTPEHPKAQLGTWQRNLDWYRFWLQGYERPNPEDPDQNKRWERLRDLQDAEDQAGGQPTAAKPN